MRILITGGSGLIGSKLVKHLLKEGHEVQVLTRNKAKARKTLGNDVRFVSKLESLEEIDAVVNLAGEPLWGKRWTYRQKAALIRSRIDATSTISELVNSSKNPPKVFISGSAVGYYGPQADNCLDENAHTNDDFLHRLCQKWEDAAMASQKKTRVCIMRTGVVLSPDGGMLAVLKPFFRLGLGATIGNGKQYMSWIHISDMVGAIDFLLNENSACGAYNMCAPHPVTNRQFSSEFASSLHRPCFLRVPAFLLKLVLGEAAMLATISQRAIPSALCNAGFNFRFGRIKDAFSDFFEKKN